MVVTTVFGQNTTSLNTSAGTLSASTTGYSDTWARYGSFGGSSNLNRAIALSTSIEIDFTSFALGLNNHAGGFFIQLQDSAQNYLSYLLSQSDLTALVTNNGGTFSTALSNFTASAGSYSGVVDGINFGIIDRDITATITEARFNDGATAVPEPGTASLVLLSLAGLGFGRRKKMALRTPKA